MIKPYQPHKNKEPEYFICPLCDKPITGAIYSYHDKVTKKNDPICGNCNVKIKD